MRVLINETTHVWVKENLITISSKKGCYDILVCEKCGLKGKRFRMDAVDLPDHISYEYGHNCPKGKIEIPEIIKVTRCTASGSQFMNIEPGSIHFTVEPPTPYKNDAKGVWVQGRGDKVKLLRKEYVEFILKRK